MNAQDIERAKAICRAVAEDMASDASTFDGRPFTGRVVAEYFGNQGAAIAALADLIRAMLNDFPATPSEQDQQAVATMGRRG